MKITLKLLNDLRACSVETNDFMQLYPDGVEVTRETALAAMDADLSVDWLLRRLSKKMGNEKDADVVLGEIDGTYYTAARPHSDALDAALHLNWMLLEEARDSGTKEEYQKALSLYQDACSQPKEKFRLAIQPITDTRNEALAELMCSVAAEYEKWVQTHGDTQCTTRRS